MTSESSTKEAFVWTWLANDIEPVVAGKLTVFGSNLLFNYGSSYLKRKDAISLYDVELPLKKGTMEPLRGLSIAGCIRDAAPDAWGRRVILNTRFGLKGKIIDTEQIDELTYMLESGSDRIGALDFQKSASIYEARINHGATLDELLMSAERIEKGLLLPPALAQVIQHGSSIGGARPKALLEGEDKKYVAKFSLQSDSQSLVKAEYVAMSLAKLAGLNVAPVSLVSTMGKDVLLIERFDRISTKKGWLRKNMVSALTILQLDEMMARYASYQDLADIIRRDFSDPKETLRELFGRIVFNILCGNTDDHARNHAAFWNGTTLSLTPAYDICPQARVGREATQAMLISAQDRRSLLLTCRTAAPAFLLSDDDAVTIIERQVSCIEANWERVCNDAQLAEVDRNLMWRRQFLNPYAFEGFPDSSRKSKW